MEDFLGGFGLSMAMSWATVLVNGPYIPFWIAGPMVLFGGAVLLYGIYLKKDEREVSKVINDLQKRLEEVAQNVSGLREMLQERAGIGNVHNEVNDIQRELSSIEQDYWSYLLAEARSTEAREGEEKEWKD